MFMNKAWIALQRVLRSSAIVISPFAFEAFRNTECWLAQASPHRRSVRIAGFSDSLFQFALGSAVPESR